MILEGLEELRTTYVVVPIRVSCPDACEQVIGIDWTDDGEPGPWGDTYRVGHDEWLFDPLAQQAAIRYLRELLSRVSF